MGGIGSGAKRSANVGYVEHALALDIRALRRLRVVMPGRCVIDTVQWRFGGLPASSARLRVDLSDDIERGGDMIVSGVLPGGAIKQRVAIVAVPSPFGGHRCFWVCPVTGGKVEVLYYADGRFASRKAQGLTYAVQGMDPLSAARKRVGKLRRRLKGEGVPRPRGRNRAAMIVEVEQAETLARALYFERLAACADRSGTRRMPRRGR